MKKIGKSAIGLLSYIFIYLLFFVLIFFGLKFAIANNYITLVNTEEKGQKGITTSNESRGTSQKQEREKINLLITGIGGGNHDAPNLTDTIILASFHPEKDTITMLSIPRDLYVKHPDVGDNRTGKINWVYVSSFKKGQKQAMYDLAKKVTEITGEKIDYYASVNFNGLKEIVNILGGIEIDVPQAIVDYEYPTYNYGYTTFSIGKGLQTLDGETALRYARSRHTTSDFSRSMRQQEIIKAIKTKASELGYLKDARKIKSIYDALSDNLQTDMPFKEILKMAIILSENNGTILSKQFNDSCYTLSSLCRSGGFVYTPPRSDFNGASVFLINGNTRYSLSNYERTLPYGDIIFNYPKIHLENIVIDIFNESGTSGQATYLANLLTQYDFQTEAKKGKMDLDVYNLPPETEELGNIDKNTKKTENQNLEKIQKNTIYYDKILENSDTLLALKKYLDMDFVKEEKLEGTKKIVIDIVNKEGMPKTFLKPIGE